LKILLVCANGGHLSEMRELADVYKEHDVYWITYYGPDSLHIKNAFFYKDNKSVIFKMVKQLLTVWYVILRRNPDVMISTGAAIAIPAGIFMRLFFKKVIYIDCGTNIYNKSGTGKYMQYISNVFLTQWPWMVRKYRNARYWGGLR